MILLFRKYGNIAAHRFLALFILFISVSIGGYTLYDSRYLLQHPHFVLTYNAFDFAVSPLFYFHVLALTKKDFKWKPVYWLHFIPVLLVFIYKIPFYIMSADEKVAWLKRSYEHISPDYLAISILTTVQMFVYILLCYGILVKHAENLKNYFSEIESRNLNYIRIFFYINVGMFLVCISMGLIGYEEINNISNLVFTGTVYWLGYRDMNQPDIFKEIKGPVVEPQEISASSASDLSENKKYLKSEIAPDLSKKVINQLNELMQKDKLYLNPGLNLQILSQHIGISNHNLSQILNQSLNENFYDYINRFRVEEVKAQLKNPKKSHFSLLGIAMDCGFNSKAAFNIAFKKYTGITPSEFRNNESPNFGTAGSD